MPLTITTLYACLLVPLFLILWFGVTKTRADMGVSIGHNDDVGLHEKIRRHGNFIEWVPFVLILMALAEMRGGHTIALHVAGGLFVAGRILHPFGLIAGNAAAPMRIAGNSGGLIAVLILTALNVQSLI